MTDRMYLIGQALVASAATGQHRVDNALLKDAIWLADALLAAAGEKDDPATHEDCVSVAVHNAVMDRLQVDFDALKARAEAAESKLAACERERDNLGTKVAELEVAGERRESINQGLKHEIGMLALEIAALKRRMEPLTEEEAEEGLRMVNELAGTHATERTINAVGICDRIRARRA
jgi:hypothetical protein